MKSIGIFCGSSAGEHPLYLETARLVGRTRWRSRGWRLSMAAAKLV